MKRTGYAAAFNTAHLGKTICVQGWVESVRDHGELIFVDLRDRSGLIQLVFDPSVAPAQHKQASELRDEWVIEAEGEVVRRSPETVNPKLPTGEIEVRVARLDALNTSKTPPFQISHGDVGDEIRLQYRYLDLRRPDMQQRLMFRARATGVIRRFLDDEGFIELETPFLCRSTPEGARDFLVPSRLKPGAFYALPQSPQLFKQLFMVSGFDRYYQVARCFRDEDLRADRQPEFTQIDLEMSFIEPDDVINVIDRLLAILFKDMLGHTIQLPIPRISYDDAVETYGTDAPDLRFGLPLVNITDLVPRSEFGVFKKVVEAGGIVKGIRVPGGAAWSRKDVDDLIAFAQRAGAGGMAWFKVSPENDLASNIAKYFPDDLRRDIRDRMKAEPGDLVCFIGEPKTKAHVALNQLRKHLGAKLGLIKNEFNFVWVQNFPLVDYDAEEKRFVAMHHPFTAATNETRELLASDPARARAQAYDIVLNGSEIGGGSIRNHRVDWQMAYFKALGLDDNEVRAKFGFLLDALAFGAPPHGGIALGLDRIMMLMLKTDSIRDAIAFPKNQRGVDLCFDAPADVDEKQLRELSIRVRQKPATPS